MDERMFYTFTGLRSINLLKDNDYLFNNFYDYKDGYYMDDLKFYPFRGCNFNLWN